MGGERVTEQGRPAALTGPARVGAVDVEQAYRDLAPAVLGYLRLQLAAEAEDLLGEVFVQVVRDVERFEGDRDDLRHWVFTIAHHRLIDHFRRLRRAPRMVPLADEHDDPDVARDADWDAGRDVVHASIGLVDPALVDALGRLTEDQRTVVVLRFVADLRLEDVARIMRRSVDAVKALQHRALSGLAASLAVSAELVTAEVSR
jgi:RNA polymerase sigma-70 factor (ECF subfamily)